MQSVNPCELSSCSAADLQTTRYLAYVLCGSVGGIGNASQVNAAINATQTAPSPAIFTGGAGRISGGAFAGTVVLGLMVVACVGL